MRKLLFAATVLLMSALAGCSDDAESTADVEVDCPAETHFTNETGACVAHVEPSIVLTGLNGTVQQYSAATFEWALDPGTRNTEEHTVHSMDSRILGSMSDDPVSNETGPDDWGDEIAKQQHKNFPDSFEGQLVWDEAGTLYLKGYMLIEGENVWQDLGSIEITPVSASGTVETVTIQSPESAGGAPAVDDGEVGLIVGDGVSFQNDNAFDYEATFDCSDVSIDPMTLAAGETTGPVTFFEPTSCTVTLNTAFAATGNDPGEITVKINVNTP